MWGFFLGMLAFAVTLNIKYAWVLMGGGLALHIIEGYVLEARRKRAQTS